MSQHLHMFFKLNIITRKKCDCCCQWSLTALKGGKVIQKPILYNWEQKKLLTIHIISLSLQSGQTLNNQSLVWRNLNLAFKGWSRGPNLRTLQTLVYISQCFWGSLMTTSNFVITTVFLCANIPNKLPQNAFINLMMGSPIPRSKFSGAPLGCGQSGG